MWAILETVHAPRARVQSLLHEPVSSLLSAGLRGQSLIPRCTLSAVLAATLPLFLVPIWMEARAEKQHAAALSREHIAMQT